MKKKFNINVGDKKNPNVEEGIQDKSIISYNLQNKSQYGMVKFSNTAYWLNDGVFNTDYGTEQYNDIYDTNYAEATGNNYSIAYYVEKYVDYLETLGATHIKGRLITFKELIDLGCINSTSIKYNCAENFPFLYKTSYWLGSTRLDINDDLNYVYRVNSDSWFGGFPIILDNAIDLRPAIDVPIEYVY